MNVENLIWIEPNYKENPEYLNILKSKLNITNLFTFEDVEKGIKQIIEIKFEELFVVINGELIDGFFAELNNCVNKLNVIVNLIIFANEKRKNEIIGNKSKYENFPFFDIQLVFVNILDVIKKITSDDIEKYFSDDSKFSFELIENERQMLMPVNYHKIISYKPIQEDINNFTGYINEEFKSNFMINKLLKYTYISNIPDQILIKYWLKLYTIPDFSEFINNHLKKKEGYNFRTYIQLLYFGLKVDYISPCTNNQLYRGSIIIKNELSKMQNFIKKENDYHGYICYSKIFLLFHIDKNIILKIMEQKKPKENEELVLFELEQPNKFDKENATNTDISEFSLNPKNKKILFFPYSCFEISEISKNEKKYYTIRLEYLGKYVDKLPKRFEDINDIPESQFTQDFLSSQIYSQKGIERLIAKKPNFLPFSFKKYITDKNKESIINIYCK